MTYRAKARGRVVVRAVAVGSVVLVLRGASWITFAVIPAALEGH